MSKGKFISWLKSRSSISSPKITPELAALQQQQSESAANQSSEADDQFPDDQTDEIKAEKPILPNLSDRQKQLITESWTELQTEIYHVGVVSFISLFEHKLDFRRSFKQFKNLTVDELRISPLVKAHAMSILHVIEQLVGRINQEEKWEEIIDSLARRHTGHDAKASLAKDVAAQCWKSMEPILKSHGKYDAEVEEAWIQVIGWLGAQMEFSLSMYLENRPHPSSASRAMSLY